MNRNSLWLALALALPLTVAAAATTTLAHADSPPAAAHEARPAMTKVVIDGRFQRYLVSPRGQVTGMLLESGSVVRVPPRAFSKDAPELKAGDLVHVEGEGIKTGDETLVMRALVVRDRVTVADARSLTKPEGHRGHHGRKGEARDGEQKHAKAPLAELSATGKIVAIVTGPKGRVADLVLDDGTTATAGWKSKLGELGLKVGDQVTLSGRGGVYAKGKGMMIQQVKLPGGQIRTIEHGHRGQRRPQGQPV